MFSYAWHAGTRTIKGYRSKSFSPDRLFPFSAGLFFRIPTQPSKGRLDGVINSFLLPLKNKIGIKE